MDNLWTNINDNIPMYMNEICKEHKLECVKISPLKTAMVGEGFAIMIAIDRFDIEIYYLYKKDRDIVKYSCGSFFAQAYDSHDRENFALRSSNSSTWITSPSVRAIPINLKTVVSFLGGWCP